MKTLSAFIISLCLALILPAAAMGRSLSVTAGEIARGGVIDASDNALTINGTVNAADLHEIAVRCTGLSSLNLGSAEIAAYQGDAVVANRGDFPADELPAYSLSGLSAKELVLPAGLKAIGDGALLSAAVENLTIPAGVTTIGSGAFADCVNLKKITVPATVASVGSHAFKGCTSLAEVNYYPAEVPAEAFASCTALAKVVFGQQVATIGGEAFNGCRSLSRLELAPASALRTIGPGAFSATGFTELDLSGCTSLTSVGTHAFSDCRRLEALMLPASVVSIGEGVLSSCPSLQAFEMPEGVSEVPALAFKGDSGLTDVSGVMKDGVTTVGDLAFAGVSEAVTVTIPESMESIGSGAFEGWTSLGSVMAEKLKSVPVLGSDVWFGVDCPAVELIVAEGMDEAFATADQWKDFKIRLYGESTVFDPTVSCGPDGVHARLAGGNLTVESASPFSSVAVFDIDGRCLLQHQTGAVTEFSAPAPVEASKVYIVSITLTDGAVAAFKLLAAEV